MYNTIFYFNFYYIFTIFTHLFLRTVLLSGHLYVFFDSACNPDCSICMNSRDCRWFFLFSTFCFAEYTIFQDQYFTTNFVIIINTFFCFHALYYDQFGVAYSLLFFPVSYEGYTKQHILSKYCCPW